MVADRNHAGDEANPNFTGRAAMFLWFLRHDFCQKPCAEMKIEQLNMTGTGQVHVVNHRKKMVSVKSSDSRSS